MPPDVHIRRLSCSVAFIALAACGASTGPTQAGTTYVLQSIDGRPVPTPSNIGLLAGMAVTWSGFSLDVPRPGVWSTQVSAGASTAANVSGNWAAEGDSIVLVPTSTGGDAGVTSAYSPAVRARQFSSAINLYMPIGADRFETWHYTK